MRRCRETLRSPHPHQRPDAAGAAAALLGFLQTVVSAAVAPLVGLGPADSATLMAIAVGTLGAAALLALLALGFPARRGTRSAAVNR